MSSEVINGELRGHTGASMVSSEVTRTDCLFFRTVQEVNCPHFHTFLHKLREVITRSDVAMGILENPEKADSTSDEKRSIK